MDALLAPAVPQHPLPVPLPLPLLRRLLLRRLLLYYDGDELLPPRRRQRRLYLLLLLRSKLCKRAPFKPMTHDSTGLWTSGQPWWLASTASYRGSASASGGGQMGASKSRTIPKRGGILKHTLRRCGLVYAVDYGYNVVSSLFVKSLHSRARRSQA